MIVAIHLLIIFGIAWRWFRWNGLEYPRVFWLAFLFRLVMGVALGLLYRYYYTANDTWLFFQDANVIAQLAKTDFAAWLKFLVMDEVPVTIGDQLVNSEPRSLFLIRFMSVFSWIGGDNYWITAAWFSLISFVAAWYVFTVFTRVFASSWIAAAFAFLFFPSIVFWSSGLVKETLALAGIYLATGVFLKLIHEQKVTWVEWALALIGFWMAWSLKYYWAAMFGAIVITYLVVFFLSRSLTAIKKHNVISWLVIFIFFSAAASLLHPNFHLHRFLQVLIANHDAFIRISDDDGLIHFYHLHANWGSVILNSPWALLSGLFRPLVWEANGMAAILASIENLVIVVLLLSALSGFKKEITHRLLLFSAVMYITLLCIFLALSTPNLGTLSRYRVGFLPFLIFIISYHNPLVVYLCNRMKFLQP